MTRGSERKLPFPRSQRETQRGRAPSALLFLVTFLAGVTIGGFAVYRITSRPATGGVQTVVESQPVTTANEATVVNRIASPGNKGAPVVVWQPKADAAAIEDVKRSIPDISSVSIEEGTRILREAAFKEFAATAQEMRSQVNEAEQRLAKAQNGASEAEQQAAMKHLQDIQQKQTEELKKVAERSQARIAALQQLKSGKP